MKKLSIIILAVTLSFMFVSCSEPFGWGPSSKTSSETSSSSKSSGSSSSVSSSNSSIESSSSKYTFSSLEEYVDSLNETTELDYETLTGEIYTTSTGIAFKYTYKNYITEEKMDELLAKLDKGIEQNSESFQSVIDEIKEKVGIDATLDVIYCNSDGTIIKEQRVK